MIEAGVPCGDFVLEPGASCVFLGAGVGITPLLSMMKVAASNGAKVMGIKIMIMMMMMMMTNIIITRHYYHLFQNTLIYRASNPDCHPFREEIETAISSAAEGSTVHWMYSSDKVSVNV